VLSIIVPTYNEKKNVFEVASRVGQAMKDRDYEIVFVDDSSDETPEALKQLAGENPRVRFRHRENERGLATAVILGFQEARGDILAVMDADLQHPPELLPVMQDKIQCGFDLVIPSRFIPGGDDGGLSGLRKIVSKTARLIAQVFLRGARLTTDPMSGFFMFKNHVIEGVEFNPVGWKIFLEILVKGRCRRIGEVPYRFRPRAGDISKMSWREQWNYLRHICRLVLNSPPDLRFWKFALVGLSGVGVNMLVFAVSLRVFGLPVLISSVTASGTAMFSNFLLNDKFTWPDVRRHRLLNRAVRFYLFCSAGIVINVAVLSILHQWLGLNKYLGQLAGIFMATLWNFITNNRWTWGNSPETD